MTFKKGDKVKFLNDTGGGIITRIDNKTLYVQNGDGFEIPVLESQLLKAEVSQNESTPFTETVKQPATPNAQAEAEAASKTVLDYIDLSKEPAESNIDPTVNLLLAWIANRKKNGQKTYDVYLINDCSYHIMYVAAMVAEGVYRGIQAGMLEGGAAIHLTEISAEELKLITSIRLESIFFKQGTYMPQEPMRYELKTDEFYLTDPFNYVSNEYFNEKALIYHISEEFLMSEIENTAREVQSKFEKQKKHIDSPKARLAKKEPKNMTEEVDLHIEELVENPNRLSPAEMLNIQLGRFNIALEGAMRNRQERIVFIHGVGNGRLRLEIKRALDQKYPRLRYQDASFKEYGYGATLVFL